MTDLVTAVRNGDRRALARMLTIVENEREGVDEERQAADIRKAIALLKRLKGDGQSM